MKCQYCSTEAKLVPGVKIFGNNNEKSKKLYWSCSFCGAYVRCHKGTTSPIGQLANAEDRELRYNVHMSFDAIWLNGYKTRTGCYVWLARELKIPFDKCHLSNFTKEQLKKVEKICKDFLNKQ